MKHWLTASGMAALIALTAGCARLQVYKDENLEGPETGFKFYVSKPYLLVAFTNNPTGELEVSVVHVPDVSTPYYAKPQPGLLGNSNLTMNFSNGVLTSFGQQVDSGATALLDSVGGLRKAFAEAGKLDREARGAAATVAAAPEPTQKGKVHAEAAARLATIVSGLRRYAGGERLTPLERENVLAYTRILDDAAAKLRDQHSERHLPGVLAAIDQMLYRWDSQIPAPASGNDFDRQNLAESKRQVAEVFLDLAPKTSMPAPFLLYEITSTGGVISLKPVRLGG